MAKSWSIKVNGKVETVVAERETPLLYVLRNDLGCNGPKFGCGLGQCGACAVLRDGMEIRSCIMPISTIGTAEIITCEGLGTVGQPHAIQSAFIAEQAAQCGYCISGMVIAAVALLNANPDPSLQEIKAGMNGHLCRCGTHLRIVKAIQRAAGRAG